MNPLTGFSARKLGGMLALLRLGFERGDLSPDDCGRSMEIQLVLTASQAIALGEALITLGITLADESKVESGRRSSRRQL